MLFEAWHFKASCLALQGLNIPASGPEHPCFRRGIGSSLESRRFFPGSSEVLPWFLGVSSLVPWASFFPPKGIDEVPHHPHFRTQHALMMEMERNKVGRM